MAKVLYFNYFRGLKCLHWGGKIKFAANKANVGAFLAEIKVFEVTNEPISMIYVMDDVAQGTLDAF